MKEDYLWDKSGADPAIEKLEKTLSDFRFDESSLRMPVAAHSRSERAPFFRFLSFGFAGAAACVAVAVISWALWNRAPAPNNPFPDEAQTFTKHDVTASPGDTLPGKPDVREISRPAIRTGHRKGTVKRPVGTAIAADRPRNKKPETVNLTKEEIYAYNRLMLALSITSDKLNLVKEKITGE